jgi:N-acetylmuramoyl-L-alanine amidase
VLTENLFMDNKEDVQILLSAEGKRVCADVHVEGIMKFLG